MSINLVQAIEAAMSDKSAEHLAQQFGIPAHIVRQLASRSAPGLVAALMERASLSSGARALYSMVMLPETNAYIVDQFDKLISTTGGLKHLESNGHALFAHATGQRMDMLTDAVSAETGVPTQATSALAGIVAGVLFGIVKRHFLLAQWTTPQLPALLRDQIGEMKTSLTNGVAAAIGVGSTEGFVNTVAARLDAVTATLEERDETTVLSAAAASVPAIGARPAPEPAPAPAAPAPANAPRKVSPPMPPRPPARKPVKKKSNKWIWLLFAVLAAILAAVYYRGFTQQNNIDLNPSAATSPATAPVEPASSAAAEPVMASDAALPLTASASSADASSAASAPVASAPVASTADWKDAQLLFNVSAAGVPSVQATVGTEAEKQSIIQALEHRFGKGYSADISVVRETRPATWLSRLKDLMPLMSVPGAEVKLNGSKVELSGAAADGKLGWVDRLKTAFGGAFQVGSFDVDGAVASAAQSFRASMKTLLAADDACSGDKLTKVLDMQVVNFARSSATVPETAYSTLGQTAELLKSCAAKGSMVKLEVAGYSDSTGQAPAKLEMSKERAQAVRGFLVREGVPPQSLTATGFGDANPIADNATESGRFTNRRIAFVVR